MPDYRRYRIPGGTYFFTINLLERRSDLLIRHIEALRDAVRRTRADRPFHIDAWVVMPDHLHCVLTLPPGDDDFSNRIKAIKIRFVRSLAPVEGAPRRACRARGTRHLAAALLGTRHPQRRGLCPASRLRPLQPGQARPRRDGGRLAVLYVPPLGGGGGLSGRLGWRGGGWGLGGGAGLTLGGAGWRPCGGDAGGRFRGMCVWVGGTPRWGFRPTLMRRVERR